MKFCRWIAVCFIVIKSTILLPVKAQYFNTGQDPANIRWRYINTSDFQLVYPADVEGSALYMASFFNSLLSRGGYSLNQKTRKFPVLVHAHGAISNGLVAWAPKRVELYTTPSQTNFSQPWLDHLMIHEFRHVVQMNKVEQGFTRFLKCIFGQQATAAVVGLYIPKWFLEGDAVVAETALSLTGRGRSPFFQQELRAQLLEKGIYSYDKAVLGSYKDHVPDYYKLGYYMVALGRKNYGTQLWEKTIANVGRNPLGVTSFSSGLLKTLNENRMSVVEAKKEWLKSTPLYDSLSIDMDSLFNSHLRKDAKIMLYQDNMRELFWKWKMQDKRDNLSDFNILSPKVKVYTNYRFPHYNENGGTVYLKSGLADVTHFVNIKDGVESTLFTPGINLSTSFDIHNGILLWSEFKNHVRWQHGTRSTLILYDNLIGKRRRFYHKYNLFAPAFSNDGKQIIAVEVKPNGENALVVLDSESGNLLNRIVASENDFYITPTWSGDDKGVVAVVLNKNGKRLEKIDLKSGKGKILLSSTYTDISQPRMFGKYLFFTGAFTGIDNIYVMNLENNDLFQVTSSRFGASDPHISGNGTKLLYSDYTADGYCGIEMNLNPNQWKNFTGDSYVFDLAESLSAQERGIVAVDDKQQSCFTSKRYSRLGHLINFHSWAPVFIDGIEQETDIGFSLATQNLLNTLMATAGYRRGQGFTNGQYYVNLSYRRWFPVIDSRIIMGDRDLTYFTLAQRTDEGGLDTLRVKSTWTQWGWENSISLPLNISRGKFFRSITPKVTYNRQTLTRLNTRVLSLITMDDSKQSGSYYLDNSNRSQNILEYQLFVYSLQKSALRDLQPRWGQVLAFNYRHTPWGDTRLGESWSGESTLYFPGFFRHQGFKLYGGYQYRSFAGSSYSNSIRSPRGIEELYGKEIATLGVDYKFPLFYPDWNIGPIAYFKRFTTGIFMDLGCQKGSSTERDNSPIQFEESRMSFGMELNANMHVLRFPAPLNLGIRAGYEDQTRSNFVNLLLRIDFSSL